MNVITVLMVQMTVVYVIYVSIVLNGLMPITFVMGTFVILVDQRFGVLFTVVYVIYVSIVLDGLMTITGQMFMIWGGMTIGHTCSFGRSVFPGRHQSGPLSTPSPNHLGGFGRISTEHVLRFRK